MSGVSIVSDTNPLIYLLYALTAKSRKDILAYLGLKNHFDNFKRHIAPLLEKGWLYMTFRRNQPVRTKNTSQLQFKRKKLTTL